VSGYTTGLVGNSAAFGNRPFIVASPVKFLGLSVAFAFTFDVFVFGWDVALR
jgi:hypothetical protein